MSMDGMAETLEAATAALGLHQQSAAAAGSASSASPPPPPPAGAYDGDAPATDDSPHSAPDRVENEHVALEAIPGGAKGIPALYHPVRAEYTTHETM